ncbi:unnamed protein product, partial [Pleuronectes platessa]
DTSSEPGQLCSDCQISPAPQGSSSRVPLFSPVQIRSRTLGLYAYRCKQESAASRWLQAGHDGRHCGLHCQGVCPLYWPLSKPPSWLENAAQDLRKEMLY